MPVANDGVYILKWNLSLVPKSESELELESKWLTWKVKLGDKSMQGK
jgi:hypothetical protein